MNFKNMPVYIHQCPGMVIPHEPLRLPVLLYVCRAEGVHVGSKLVHGTAKSNLFFVVFDVT